MPPGRHITFPDCRRLADAAPAPRLPTRSAPTLPPLTSTDTPTAADATDPHSSLSWVLGSAQSTMLAKEHADSPRGCDGRQTGWMLLYATQKLRLCEFLFLKNSYPRKRKAERWVTHLCGSPPKPQCSSQEENKTHVNNLMLPKTWALPGRMPRDNW